MIEFIEDRIVFSDTENGVIFSIDEAVKIRDYISELEHKVKMLSL